MKIGEKDKFKNRQIRKKGENREKILRMKKNKTDM